MRVVTVGCVMVLALVAAACKPSSPAKKVQEKSAPVAEPKWRHFYADKEMSSFATPVVQTVGQYKRIWITVLYAKPERQTVEDDEGLVARVDRFTEFDCAETRVRDLQVTVTDEKDWSASVPLKDTKWIYVNPDAKWMPIVRHVCHGEKMAGEGFPSMEAASATYRKKIADGDSAQR